MLENVKSEVKNFIELNNLDNIVSIYGIGSIAKNKENIGDIDLNVFLYNCNFSSIMQLEELKSYLFEKLHKDTDFNVIDMSIVNDGLLESDIFPHKNRHSLFLYELRQLNVLIYGKSLLENLEFNTNDLKKECVKLTLTLVQRLNRK